MSEGSALVRTGASRVLTQCPPSRLLGRPGCVGSRVEEAADMLKFGSPRKDEPPAKAEPAVEPPIARAPLLVPDAPRMEGPQMPMSNVNNAESILAAGLTIEGKIKGTVKVNGELTIEPGAFIEGEITAESVLVAGDVRGQIAAATRVEFKDSGTLIGDVKASSVVVSAGSKMRGKMEFGWKEGEGEAGPPENGSQPSSH